MMKFGIKPAFSTSMRLTAPWQLQTISVFNEVMKLRLVTHQQIVFDDKQRLIANGQTVGTSIAASNVDTSRTSVTGCLYSCDWTLVQ
jgi:hypothetical protein